MGNECPNGPCKELTTLPPRIQSLYTDYTFVEPGFSYDVDGYTRFFEGMHFVDQGWDQNNNGVRWDDWKLEAKYSVPLDQWKSQVRHTKRFVSTERERIAAEMFTNYSMSVKLGREFDAGLCMISNTTGAVCLMRSGQEIDTYRLSLEEWADVARKSSQRDAVRAVKDSEGLQSAFKNDAVMWMDEWYCSEDGFAGFVCTSYMPAW